MGGDNARIVGLCISCGKDNCSSPFIDIYLAILVKLTRRGEEDLEVVDSMCGDTVAAAFFKLIWGSSHG